MGDIEQVLNLIQEEFEKLLQNKTSWGRNELLLAFERAKVTALTRLLNHGR